MDQNQRLIALATEIGGKIKALNTNDVNFAAQLAAVTGGLSTLINDVNVSTATTYSSSKIVELNNALKAEILGGASAAYDTLLEIQQALTGDATNLAELLAAVNNRVRFDAEQVLTTAQKLTACTNIGIGDPDTDLVAVFNAALV